jgi:molybdopterin-guanine dinucleotide biosynthesis protein A
VKSSLVSEVTGVLLAGGKSRRMGRDKRLLAFGEETLLARSLAALRSVFQHVLVVVAQDSPAIETDMPVLRDVIPDCGSLGGLYTGLKQAGTEWVFAAACDMPFLDSATIRHFLGLKHEGDVVMAKLRHGLQPMHALYHRNCLPVMERLIQARDFKIHRLADHPALRVRLVLPEELHLLDPETRSFYNINTPDDLDAARVLHENRAKPSTA